MKITRILKSMIIFFHIVQGILCFGSFELLTIFKRTNGKHLKRISIVYIYRMEKI